MANAGDAGGAGPARMDERGEEEVRGTVGNALASATPPVGAVGMDVGREMEPVDGTESMRCILTREVSKWREIGGEFALSNDKAVWALELLMDITLRTESQALALVARWSLAKHRKDGPEHRGSTLVLFAESIAALAAGLPEGSHRELGEDQSGWTTEEALTLAALMARLGCGEFQFDCGNDRTNPQPSSVLDITPVEVIARPPEAVGSENSEGSPAVNTDAAMDPGKQHDCVGYVLDSAAPGYGGVKWVVIKGEDGKLYLGTKEAHQSNNYKRRAYVHFQKGGDTARLASYPGLVFGNANFLEVCTSRGPHPALIRGKVVEVKKDGIRIQQEEEEGLFRIGTLRPNPTTALRVFAKAVDLSGPIYNYAIGSAVKFGTHVPEGLSEHIPVVNQVELDSDVFYSNMKLASTSALTDTTSGLGPQMEIGGVPGKSFRASGLVTSTSCCGRKIGVDAHRLSRRCPLRGVGMRMSTGNLTKRSGPCRRTMLLSATSFLGSCKATWEADTQYWLTL